MVGVPHTPGTREYLTCERGTVELAVAGERYRLDEGDVVSFRGDQRHGYHNPGKTPAVAYSVIAFAPTAALSEPRGSELVRRAECARTG